ncbi:TetR/AcrR family transcriptional regulator [Salinibacterium hongtaonis]|uniref:TetR/AcrR family transcriptional regulator n=1 Tax=Homoserinimonas hongtaonis TaxID=2079791 RepID=A0A2U1SXR1_9MICO|nr:TetR/AcrR family transcriptional regulator [Salinibacterium hongtaonis]AWB88958.1 hypothetical protein C2138_04860 [Salinibacterium hongtaonis]PWB96420.1 TetR/AcrR family transcriptional regulator [Salinibacterium hongtaonis]
MSEAPHTEKSIAGMAPREKILSAAAVAFSDRGYHSTSIAEICSESGVDIRTFAELFTTKYELFREVAFSTSANMLKATEGISGTEPRQAKAAVQHILAELARSSIATRAVGGFYRTQSRNLEPDDLAQLFGNLAELRRRIREPLLIYRPELSVQDANALAAAALSTIASITIHPTSLPDAKIFTLLTVSAQRMLESDPTSSIVNGSTLSATPVTWQSDTSERGSVLAVGVQQLYDRGYDSVTLESIAAQSGLSVEAVQSHFATTSDLLLAACNAGFDALQRDTERALACSSKPREVLGALSHAYVQHYFEDPHVMTIFLADGRNLDDENRRSMLQMQEYTIGRWASTLLEIRPELSPSEATFIVFAALSVVADLGILFRWKNDDELKTLIERCVLTLVALR